MLSVKKWPPSLCQGLWPSDSPVLFTEGMAWPLGLTMWLPLADRMKQKWWCQLDSRPQRSCLFPPTFNTSAFTVSIKPWWAHKSQEKKGRLEHRYRSIELHQTQNYPSHWDQLTLWSTWGCVNKLSWDPATSIHLNYTDAHAWFLTEWELTTANS